MNNRGQYGNRHALVGLEPRSLGVEVAEAVVGPQVSFSALGFIQIIGAIAIAIGGAAALSNKKRS